MTKTLVDQLGRTKCSVLFVLGVMKELHKYGWVSIGATVEPPWCPLTAKGVGIFDQLEAEGFIPTNWEVAASLVSIGNQYGGFRNPSLVEFLCGVVDNWPKVKDSFLSDDLKRND